jgi:hypothetical protein
LGVLATLAGAVFNHWLSVDRVKREREAPVRERWREQAFSVLGPLGTWLTDADPQGLGIIANKETNPEVFANLRRRCDEMREELAVLSVGFPSDRGRDLAGNLEVAIFNSLASAPHRALTNAQDNSERLVQCPAVLTTGSGSIWLDEPPVP